MRRLRQEEMQERELAAAGDVAMPGRSLACPGGQARDLAAQAQAARSR